MAIITKSSTSGNWNATSSWVGGVVPTSADDVIFDGTSAGVILNVASSVKSLDMTGFVATFTQSANLTISGTTDRLGQAYTTAANCIVSGSYNHTGTGVLTWATNLGFQQLDTTPRFYYSGPASTTANFKLYSDVYPLWGGANLTQGFSGVSGNAILNFGATFSIIYKGSALNPAATINNRFVFRGNSLRNFSTNDNRNDHFVLDLDGAPYGQVEATLNLLSVKVISGTVSCVASAVNEFSVGTPRGLYFQCLNSANTAVNGTCSFTVLPGAKISNLTTLQGGFGPFLVWLQNIDNMVFDIASDQKIGIIDAFSYNTTTGAINATTRNRLWCNSKLNVDWFLLRSYSAGTFLFQNNERPVRYQIWGGGGLSASIAQVKGTNLEVTSTYTGHPYTGTSSLYMMSRTPSLEFTSDATHNISNFMTDFYYSGSSANQTQLGAAATPGTFSSITASVPATIDIGNQAFMWRWNLKDLNFTGKTVYNIDGTLTNTTGAQTTYPTSGGQTAFTFVN